MSKVSFDLVGVSEMEYMNWCKENNKPWYRRATKVDFFTRIQDGRLVRDKDGKLARRRVC